MTDVIMGRYLLPIHMSLGMSYFAINLGAYTSLSSHAFNKSNLLIGFLKLGKDNCENSYRHIALIMFNRNILFPSQI